MSPAVDVEIRRNRHGSVLTYSDRDRASRLLEDHRGVLTSLYRLVDRRHGSDGEVVARLAIREDARVVDDLDVRERFRRDLEADRALSVVDDVRHHAGERELVTDGGVDQSGSSDDSDARTDGDEGGKRHTSVPLTWCTKYTRLTTNLRSKNTIGKRQRLPPDGGRSNGDLERIADALELQNALLLQLVQDRERERAQEHPDPDHTGRSDHAIATDVVDAYGDLYGGSVAGWEFDPVSDQVETMGDSQ